LASEDIDYILITNLKLIVEDYNLIS